MKWRIQDAASLVVDEVSQERTPEDVAADCDRDGRYQDGHTPGRRVGEICQDQCHGNRCIKRRKTAASVGNFQRAVGKVQGGEIPQDWQPCQIGNVLATCGADPAKCKHKAINERGRDGEHKEQKHERKPECLGASCAQEKQGKTYERENQADRREQLGSYATVYQHHQQSRD